MRIGEIAAIVGVTTRTVRHYHHQGLLPEPERLANGYRTYTLRHAVVLARVRRLTELGLGLAEVRDVLADDAGRDLEEVLEELDSDLARQEAELAERRQRLRSLLRTESRPTAEGPVSPELAELFARMAPVAGDSPMAARDREVLALLDSTVPPGGRERLLEAWRGAVEPPDALERAGRAYALLDALADAGPGDPRVAEAARALAACLPPGLLDGGEERTGAGAGSGDGDGSEGVFLRALYADLAPAQAEAVRLALRLASGDGP
ncbi:MerR family transcriptional regulator [Streptomyces sp. SHP 1-2]|uniref:MerR family transcriptional regulator n=1 Tax=Streptomyces sp. SHP 1-2 TaxID=2769489 RepID=UPI002237120B|nr:MerR family transcriptional regulator [Streptomyces sp. SHP 1-2]MCW5249134.1 MerR family transcriptional regulator [Streptomyces sp. SHP 1-2]